MTAECLKRNAERQNRRDLPWAADTLFGRLREPIVRFVHWARTAEVVSANDEYEIGDLSAPETMLGQSPLRSPSLFNFFLAKRLRLL